MNIPVFYNNIRSANGQPVHHIIKKAQVLGYELMPFEGWTNADHRTRKAEIRDNRKKILEIQSACEFNGDWPHITAGIPEHEQLILEDDEAMGMLHKLMNEPTDDR